MRRKVFVYLFFIFLLSIVFIAPKAIYRVKLAIGVQRITFSQHIPFGALIAGLLPSWQKNQLPIPSEEIPEPSFSQGENTANFGADRDEDLLVEKIDDLEDQIDVLGQRINEMEKQMEFLSGKNLIAQEEEKDIEEEGLGEEEAEEDEVAQGEVGQEIGQEPCSKIQGVQSAKNKIIFNEIAWMGGQASSNHEWIELKNISGSQIDLTGWQILSKENKIKIIFSGKNAIGATYGILAGGFWLLERTSDDAVPGVLADLIYTGALRNSEETLHLFDANCQLQDEIIVISDWPAGDNSSKRTMERKIDFTWQTSLSPGGTPKAENSSGYVVVTPASGGGGGGSGGAPPPVVYPKILITEVQIGAEGNEKEEFVELYNLNANDAVLAGWYLQRKTKSASGHSTFASSGLFESKVIQGRSYFLVAREDSSFAAAADIIVDNPLTEDNTLVLKNPNREIVDKVGWGEVSDFETTPAVKPLAGKSIGRKWLKDSQNYSDIDDNSKDFEIQEPTPREKNKPKINQPPIASFVFSPQNPFIGDLVLFDAASSTDPDGQIISYIWDFGDTNATSTAQATTTHSYATSTDFTISLQVMDKEEAASALATSTISVAEIKAPFPELDVVINEIAWMGTKASPNHEWIEIYNNTASTIDITGWRLASSDNNPNINFPTSSIPASDYFLLERIDDTAISDISADLIYTGVLGNNPNCEILSLYDQNDNLVDQTICVEGNWPAGRNEKDENGEWLRVSMERIDSNAAGSDSANWASNNLILRNGLDAGNPANNINGTPKAQNSASRGQDTN